jgi:hypothetical protein
MIAAILLIVINSVLVGNVTLSGEFQQTGTGSDFVMATANQALKSINSAEAAGADVSDLVARFNTAIDLQRQAERGTYASCSSYDACIVQANNMMLAIVEDASTLANQAIAKREQANVMTFTVYVPVGSFVASVAIVALYRAWQSRRAKRYQEMDIHQRGGRQ